MYDYVANELVEIVNTHLLVDAERTSINGHSMGGDGALLMETRRSDRYRSLPAVAPICAVSQRKWDRRTFKEYPSPNEKAGESAITAISSRVRPSRVIDEFQRKLCTE